MAGGGATMSENLAEKNRQLADLRTDGKVFCTMCEYDPMELSELKSSTQGGAVVYVCPECGKVLAIQLASGRVVSYQDWLKHSASAKAKGGRKESWFRGAHVGTMGNRLEY